MSKRTPKKSQKLTQHSCCSTLTRENFESNKRQWIFFHPQRCDVPYRNHHACCEKHLPKPTQMGQKIYNGMLMLLHDSMPSFLNFRRVLDLLEFINQVSQCLRPSGGGRVFNIHSHFLHGT